MNTIEAAGVQFSEGVSFSVWFNANSTRGHSGLNFNELSVAIEKQFGHLTAYPSATGPIWRAADIEILAPDECNACGIS